MPTRASEIRQSSTFPIAWTTSLDAGPAKWLCELITPPNLRCADNRDRALELHRSDSVEQRCNLLL